MVMPTKYKRAAEGAAATYNYSDIAEGRGYVVYYGASSETTTFVSPVTIYSGMTHRCGADVNVANDDDYDELIDIDFDIIFNMPQNIKGDILIQLPFGFQRTGAGDANNADYKATASVYHYDGTTETQLGSTATTEILNITGMVQGDIESHISTIKVNQSSVQHFKKGETLRFTLKVYLKHASAGALTFIGGVGCDPLNRTDDVIALTSNSTQETQVIETNEPTRLEFHVPFVIDL